MNAPLRSCLAVILLLLACAAEAAPRYVPAKQRLQQIEAALPEQPQGWGPPATDRALWARAAKTIPARDLLLTAADLAKQKPEVISDELYIRYSRDGNRDEFQEANRRRIYRMNTFAWAEGVEGKGRFVEPLRREIEAILDEKTWVLPAHDPKLNNFHGRWTEIDLMVAMKGWSLATATYWHEQALGPELVARIRAELQRRLFAPFLARVNGEKSADTDGMWWNKADNNWNAVCHSGVIGAALATLESRAERARLIGFAELNLQYYMKGFTPDGYCSEGIGYWNYGFGHFAMLSETLRRATGGVVVPLVGDHALRVAAYPWGLRILPNVFPAFADMNISDRPSTWFGALAVMQVYPKPLGMKSWGLSVNDLRTQMIYESAMKVFLPFVTEGLPAAPAPQVKGEHYWFPDAQVYTGRAAPNFGAAIKGGHNNEHHNHNDVGSFVIARSGRPVLVDPGLEVYTRRTFGPDRYVSNVLNSYGHSVPRVAGQLQGTGREFAAKVVSTSFSEAEDVVVLDLAGAYQVPALKSLVRTFKLRRGAKPEMVITDAVEFAEPSAFETALVTFEEVRERGPGLFVLSEEDAKLRVEVTASADWTLREEAINEDLPNKRKPTRLGLALNAPVTTATITVTVRPE
jgi:hypothetical protein